MTPGTGPTGSSTTATPSAGDQRSAAATNAPTPDAAPATGASGVTAPTAGAPSTVAGSSTGSVGEPIGSFCLVLHSHLPWVVGHGSWPVGEEWLHQAWATSYLPVLDLLDRLGGEGRRDLLTLGVTPVLAAQLDDPTARTSFHTWLGFWQARAEGLATRSENHLRELGSREFVASQRALAAVEGRWSGGLSPVLRPLVDDGVVELLGGPATHPFQPLLEDEWLRFALRSGLDDAMVRLGSRPEGIWAPECGYRPGIEGHYADLGVRRFLVDGPTMLGAGGSTAHAAPVGDSDVVAFARDLDVTYRVWSPRRGYPGGRWYRDFHTFDHASGFRPARVTSTTTAPEDKAPYDPDRASAAAAADAADFVDVVRRRLLEHAARDGRPGLVVAAYDTELFGHWWHEGPQWLEHVLRLLPEAGVRVTTLRGALEAGHLGPRVDLGPGSWGSGKDWRVWDGEAVADLVADNRELQRRVGKVLAVRSEGRDVARDQLARSTLLALASDWAFMVTKDSAAGYARDRHDRHHSETARLAALVERADPGATAYAARLRALDGPFGHLDARLLADTL
jgi:1,4-alpha-glucan branching enzyme